MLTVILQIARNLERKRSGQSVGLRIERSRVRVSPNALSGTAFDTPASVTEQYNLVLVEGVVMLRS